MSDSAAAFDSKKMIMNFLPMIIIFGLQALKLDYQNPDTIFWFRVIYACGITIFLVLCGLIYLTIQQNMKQLEKPLSYAEKRSTTDMMKLKNEYEALPEDQRKKTSPPEEYYMVDETEATHDLKHLRALVARTLQGAAITCAIHWYWGFMPPLIIQAVTSVTRLFENQLFLIHLLGSQKITRPFREEPGFMAKLSGEDPNAALEAYERKNKKKKSN